MPGGRSYERQIKTPKRIAKRKAELDSEGYQVSARETCERGPHVMQCRACCMSSRTPSMRTRAHTWQAPRCAGRSREWQSGFCLGGASATSPLCAVFFVCFFSPALVLHIVVLRAQAWLTARERKDFALFAPVLEEWVALTKEACTLINPDLPIYDVRAPRPAHAGRTCPPRAACF